MIVMNMRRVYNNIINALIAVLAISTTSSCVFEKQDPVKSEQNMAVEIKVSAKDMVTKAEEELTPDEEKIYSLRVYAFLGQRQIGYLYIPKSADKVLYPKAEGNNDQWFIDLRLPYEGVLDPETNIKTVPVTFYAIANEEAMTGLKYNDATQLAESMSISQLEDLKYTSSSTLDTDKGLPMWAKNTVDIDPSNYKDEPNRVDGHEGHHVIDMDPISLELYRSVAKIEVYAAEEGSTTASGIKISGVTVKNVPKTSNLFVAPSELSADGLEESAQTALKNPTDGEVAVTELTDSTNYTIESNYTTVTQPYYIAENPNGNEWSNDFNCKTQVENATAVEVSYLLPGDKTSRTGTVYLPKIVRNTHYKVFCRIRANGKAVLNVRAENWDFEELDDIEFTDIVSLQESILWSPEAGYNSTNALYTFGANAGQEATCAFTLATPQNGKWYATIEGKDIQDFVLIKGTTQSSTVSGNIGTSNDMTFTIKTLKDCTIDENLRTVNIRLVAVTSDGERSFNVNIGSNDHFTIEQKFN